MKNTLILVFLAILSISFTANAQKDPKAQSILDKMKDTYEKVEAFEATVIQEVLDLKGDPLGSFEAKATVKKNKYKLDLGDQVIYNNETTVWRHLVEDEEVSVHNNNSDSEGEEAFQSPSKMYQMYKDGFKYVLLGEERVNGQQCYLVELAPTERKKFDFFKIKMYINTTTSNLVRWVIYEKDDVGIVTQYRYTIKDFNDKLKVADSFFSFEPKKYPGIDIIDMTE